MRAYLAAASLLSLAACVPDTPYRNTAMTPASRPIGWDGRQKPAGTLHVEGEYGGRRIYENLAPELGDSALHVPSYDVGGSVTLTPVRGLDVGFRGSYAAYAWTKPTAAGTFDLPSSPNIFGVGPEVHGAIALDRGRRAQIGIAGNFLHYQVPYASYTRSDCLYASPGCSMNAPQQDILTHATYYLARSGSEEHWTYNLAVVPSYGFGEDAKYGSVTGMVGITTGFSNDGFTDVASSGSTVRDNAVVPYLGVGYSIALAPVRASILFYDALGEVRKVDYGPGLLLNVGLDLPLWRGRDAR